MNLPKGETAKATVKKQRTLRDKGQQEKENVCIFTD